MSLDDKSHRIGLLLVDGFSLMSLAALVEPFRAANALAGRALYQWFHLSTGAAQIASSGGIAVPTDQTLTEPLACDMLFVLAAGNPAEFKDRAAFARLRQLDRQGMVIGGVSGGPWLLARAGLLAGHRATVHWEHAPALQEEFPDLSLEPSLYVIDGRRLTCAGGTAAMDLAVALIERDHGATLARQVGEWFIRTEPRPADIGQRPGRARSLSTAPAPLRRMLSLMEEHLEEPLDRPALARLSGISLRQLERQCLQWLGTGVGESYLQIRLERAAELLRSTSLSVGEVALACGFRTPSHFSRRFKDRFGVAPGSASARKPV